MVKFSKLRFEYHILGFILLMGVILRVLNISEFEMQPIEQHTLDQMMNYQGDEVFLVNPQTERYTPVYEVVVKFFTAMSGLSLINMRIASVLAGIASIGLVYMLGRKLYSEETGLVSAALMGFMWPAIEMSRTAGPDMFLMMMILIGGVQFWRIVIQTTRRVGPELQSWLGFTLILTLLAYSHQFGVFPAMIMAFLSAGYAAGQKKALVPAILSLSLLVVMCAPLTLMLSEITSDSYTTQLLLSEMFVTQASWATLMQSWLFVVTGAAAALFGMIQLLRRKNEPIASNSDHVVDLLTGGWIILIVFSAVIASLFHLPLTPESLFMAFYPAVILLWSRLIKLMITNVPAYLRVGIAASFLFLIHTAWRLFNT